MPRYVEVPNITLADTESDNISITITLDDNAKGVLSKTTIAVFKQLLERLNRVAVGLTETTTFTIIANDGILASTPDTNTIVKSKSINDAPVINTVFNNINIAENNGKLNYRVK